MIYFLAVGGRKGENQARITGAVFVTVMLEMSPWASCSVSVFIIVCVCVCVCVCVFVNFQRVTAHPTK